MTPLMWLCITVVRSLAEVMLVTHPGNCECQTSVCPRNLAPFCAARFAIALALPNVKVPRDGSVASHFISFSGVMALNSRLSRVLYVESLSLLAATAVPK
jgi:hypothetical protein